MEFAKRLFNLRWLALFGKELRQLGRNRRLLVILIIPPTVMIVLFGFALDPTVTNLQLGVNDESQTFESRELISALTTSRSFQVSTYYHSAGELSNDLSAGRLDAGLIIPPDFAKDLARGKTANVQFIIDAVDANTATIAAGYAAMVIANLNQRILRARPPRHHPSQPIQAQIAAADTIATSQSHTMQELVSPPPPARSSVTVRLAPLYNPGLINSWFIATGLIGSLLVMQGSLVAASSMVREKEMGTVEQLLMTPAEAGEIITAKIAPIFLILSFDIILALTVARLVFGVPVRGSLLLFFFAGSLCVLSGIGIGTLVATFVSSQQQAQLMGFFINPPILLLSGAVTPIEAMPQWLQPFTLINPIRHFAFISRGVLLKGAGIEILYPNLLALFGFCVLLVGISVWRFRKQLR